MGCCVCIREAHVGIIESWGKFSQVALPGVTCINCFTETVEKELSLRVKQIDKDVETRTKDNVFVTIKLAVFTKVARNENDFPKKHPKKSKKNKKDKDSQDDIEIETQLIADDTVDDKVIYNAYYRLDDPEQQIISYLEEYFRFHGMEYSLDEMFAAKNDMTHELQNMLNEKMNPYGHVICNVLVKDIDPDDTVKKAMNDIIACEKEKQAQQARAEAEKITRILAAEAEARTRELAGEGIANARKAIINGLKESVEDFQQAVPDTDSNSILATVLMTQYMDTIKEAASTGRNTFILPSSPAQISNIEEQMRMALLSGGKGKKS